MSVPIDLVVDEETVPAMGKATGMTDGEGTNGKVKTGGRMDDRSESKGNGSE